MKTVKDKHLIETTIQECKVFSGEMIQLRQDTVHVPTDLKAIREFVVHPGASCILPFVAPKRIVMVRQYRYSVGQVMLELPAGKLSPNEAPLLTAQRELEEETGYRASQWEALGKSYPCIGYSDEIIYNFVAWDLTQHAPNPDEGEVVDTLEISVEEVFHAIDTGEITDGKTLATLLIAQRKGWL